MLFRSIRLPKKKDNVKKKVIEIFNPYHDKDIFSLKFFFNKLVLIRNMMLRLNFNKKNLREYNHNGSKFFTSNRIMFYTNGGFIDEHKDNNAAKFTIAKFGKYYQVILSLTKKNEDFYAGGAYVYYKKKINLDDYMEIHP